MAHSLKNFPFSIIVGIGNKARSTVDVKDVGESRDSCLVPSGTGHLDGE